MADEWTDDRLLEELEAALGEAAEVPDDVKRIGAELFSWRTIDAELAELTSDSASGHELVLSRSPHPEPRRSITVRASWLSIELDIEYQPPALRGQANPRGRPMPTEIVIEGPTHAAVTAPIDDLGYFAVDPFARPAGSFRLRCADVVTPWID